MASKDNDDPFHWESDRLVKELYTPTAPWLRKMPESAILGPKLLEFGVDGEGLLGYEEFNPGNNLKDLLAELGVTKVMHQISVIKAVMHFKSRSRGYQEFKKKWRQAIDLDGGDQEPEKMDVDDVSARTEPRDANPSVLPAGSTAFTAPNTTLTPAPSLFGNGQNSPLGDRLLGDNPLTPTALNRSHQLSENDATEGPLAKRPRRLPVLTSVDPNTVSRLDAFQQGLESLEHVDVQTHLKMDDHMQGEMHEAPWSICLSLDGRENGYYCWNRAHPETASKGLTGYEWEAEVGGREPFQCDASPTYGDAFQLRQSHVPPGLRLEVSRLMKRLLRRNAQDDRTKQGYEESDDVVDFDALDDAHDSEHEREAEEDSSAGEQEAQGVRKNKFISAQEVESVLKECVQEMQDRWAELKRSKEEKSAYKLWNYVRQSGQLGNLVAFEEAKLAHADQRLQKLIAESLQVDFTSKDDVWRQAASLETTVFLKERQQWFIKMLRDPIPPAKPQVLPRQKRTSRKPSLPRDLSDEDEETLSSGPDEDDKDDDFVVSDTQRTVQASLNELDEDFEAMLKSGESQVELADDDDGFAGDNDRMNLDDSMSGLRSKLCRPKSALREVTPASESRRGTEDDPISIPNTPASSPSHGSVHSQHRPPSRASSPEIPLDHVEAIAAEGDLRWERESDGDRLVVCLLHSWSAQRRKRVLKIANVRSLDQIYDAVIQPTLQKYRNFKNLSREALARNPELGALNFLKLLAAWLQKTGKNIEEPKIAAQEMLHVNKGAKRVPEFCLLLMRIRPFFIAAAAQPGHPRPSTVETQEPSPPVKRNGLREIGGSQKFISGKDRGDGNSEESEDDDEPLLPADRKSMRPLRHDKQAADLRKTVAQGGETMAQRRKELHARLNLENAIPLDRQRLIINESKEEDQALIYVPDGVLQQRIKDHQVEGVRFMWNQLVGFGNIAGKPNARQGCLLAHTMGLGKTMQVITLLVAIAQASRSPDLTVHSQIPDDLKGSKTLVLCPPTLVNNWMDELVCWVPDEALGQLLKIDNTVSPPERRATLQKWKKQDGVLVMGYNLFAKMVQTPELAQILQETPKIVVGDEAHMMKNPATQIHQASNKFRTASRIAMTGSPLTNNVLDYYAMINWVAPNFLADRAEFRQKFENPINAGLYAESTHGQRRAALKRLSTLKSLVEPKVHRRTIAAVHNELKQKNEFIISLPLTSIQERAYEAWIGCVQATSNLEKASNASIWSFVTTLSTLLAHPSIFVKKLRDKLAIKQETTQVATPERQSADSDGDDDDDDNDDENEQLAGGNATPDSQGTVDAALTKAAVGQVLHSVVEEITEDVRLSAKIMVLQAIMEESKRKQEKVLIFSQSLPALDYIEKLFRDRYELYRLDGQTPMKDRVDQVKQFNRSASVDGYLISTKAGGVGLNLWAANRVVMFDFKYTFSDEEQAIARSYRIGQNKNVFVYWLICEGTFEKLIQNRSVFKMQLASRVVDQKNPMAWSSLHLKEYFKPPQKPTFRDVSEHLGKDDVLDAILAREETKDLICNISLTETFQEEDPEDELTHEEKKEAALHLRMENLRRDNPSEYQRLFSQPMAVTGMASTAVARPPASLGSSLESAIAGVMHNLVGGRSAVPAASPPLLLPAAGSASRPAGRTQPVTPPIDRVRPKETPVPLPPNMQTAAASALGTQEEPAPPTLPLGMGPGLRTQFRATENPNLAPNEAPGSAAPAEDRRAPANAQLLSRSDAETAISENLDQLREALVERLDILKAEGWRGLTVAKEALYHIQKAVDKSLGPESGNLNCLERVQCLVKMATTETRFADAILGDYVKPQKLIEMENGVAATQAVCAELQKLSRPAFNLRVFGAPEPPVNSAQV